MDIRYYRYEGMSEYIAVSSKNDTAYIIDDATGEFFISMYPSYHWEQKTEPDFIKIAPPDAGPIEDRYIA